MYNCFKRAFDFCSALLLLLAISPLFIVLAIMVRIKLGSPIFFTQTRSGKNKHPFKLIKFRTMTDERDSDGNLLPDEVRLTKFGGWLRSTSLDELPELFNIINGDMSVIGPRPLQPRYDNYYTTRELLRFNVRGGLIPPESLHEDPTISWNKQLECEASYAENLSLKLDFLIMWHVFLYLFKRYSSDYGNFVRKDLDQIRHEAHNYMQVTDVLIDGLKIKVVRDDNFPETGGGIKSRKSVDYEEFLKDNDYNAVVTCGGVQSNHNRAIALMAARNNWKCHICVQGTKERFESENGNALLDRLSGVGVEFVADEQVAESMDNAMSVFKKEGLKPYYIHGGGHDIPGGTAFVKAIYDLKMRCDKLGYKPNYIYLASGTGSTQGGIVVGLDLVGWGDVKCVGISVARDKERGRSVIADYANELGKYYGLNKDYSDRIFFEDNYLYGGYEQYTPEMAAYLNEAMKKTGLLFDTTYSGKGFYGMMNEIKKNHLEDKKIIFWHTGGIMNIMK